MIAALAALALLAPAQQDNDALKKKILEDVEKRLKAQDDRLLKDIERMLDEELRKGKTPGAPAPAPKADAPRKLRGYMGVRPGDLTDEEKTALKIKNGIKVVEVVEGGPGQKAGLQKDDVITAIDGRAVDSPQEVPTLVQAAGAGAKMKVDFLRNGEKKTLEVVLGKHPLDNEEQGKADPKQEDDLRERLKKFKAPEAPKPDAPRKPAPKPAPQDDPKEDDGGLFALDEEMMEQFRGLMEQFGMDPEQFFEQGKDGKYRFKQDFQQLFKGMEKLFKDLPRGLPGLEPGEDPEPEPEPAPAPKKKAVEKKPAAPRVYLGIQGEDVGDDLRAQLDLAGGVLVADVAPGSPAEKAGVKKSDVIVKLDGKALKDADALAQFMGGAKAGQEVAVTVLRKGKEQTVTVTLGQK